MKTDVRTTTSPLRARLGALLIAGATSVALFGATHDADAQTKSKPSIGYCDRCARQCTGRGSSISACDPDKFGSCRCKKSEGSVVPIDPEDKELAPK